jgi:glyoxylase-like metal-dependent hydrolase (beta-lactamase superfamily II)
MINKRLDSPMKTGIISDYLYAVNTGNVNFFIYKNGQNTICIDSGFKKKLILRELQRIDISPKSVSHILLTHTDYDHANGIVVFPEAQIYLSSEEEQMISGKRTRAFGFIHNRALKRSYTLLHDNDIVMVGSIKVRAIATPGHTPGSMSYLVDDSILFVGDAFKIIDGTAYPISHWDMDKNQAKESIKKLAMLDNIRMVFTAHRGHTEEFNKTFSSWRGDIYERPKL